MDPIVIILSNSKNKLTLNNGFIKNPFNIKMLSSKFFLTKRQFSSSILLLRATVIQKDPFDFPKEGLSEVKDSFVKVSDSLPNTPENNKCDW